MRLLLLACLLVCETEAGKHTRHKPEVNSDVAVDDAAAYDSYRTQDTPRSARTRQDTPRYGRARQDRRHDNYRGRSLLTLLQEQYDKHDELLAALKREIHEVKRRQDQHQTALDHMEQLIRDQKWALSDLKENSLTAASDREHLKQVLNDHAAASTKHPEVGRPDTQHPRSNHTLETGSDVMNEGVELEFMNQRMNEVDKRLENLAYNVIVLRDTLQGSYTQQKTDRQQTSTLGPVSQQRPQKTRESNATKHRHRNSGSTKRTSLEERDNHLPSVRDTGREVERHVQEVERHIEETENRFRQLERRLQTIQRQLTDSSNVRDSLQQLQTLSSHAQKLFYSLRNDVTQIRNEVKGYRNQVTGYRDEVTEYNANRRTVEQLTNAMTNMTHQLITLTANSLQGQISSANQNSARAVEDARVVSSRLDSVKQTVDQLVVRLENADEKFERAYKAADTQTTRIDDVIATTRVLQDRMREAELGLANRSHVVWSERDVLQDEELKVIRDQLSSLQDDIDIDRSRHNRHMYAFSDVISQISEIQESVESLNELPGHLSRLESSVQQTDQLIDNLKWTLYSDCSEVPGDSEQAVALLRGDRVMKAICRDGWLLIQRRDRLVEGFFNRDWQQYKQGFGDPRTQYWLGNEALHEITSSREYSLRLEFYNHNGTYLTGTLRHFAVKSEDELYSIETSGFYGNSTDSFTYSNGASFSTPDKDHDSASLHCALFYEAGWWYKNCHFGNLNAYQPIWRDHVTGLWMELTTSWMWIKPTSEVIEPTTTVSTSATTDTTTTSATTIQPLSDDDSSQDETSNESVFSDSSNDINERETSKITNKSAVSSTENDDNAKSTVNLSSHTPSSVSFQHSSQATARLDQTSTTSVMSTDEASKLTTSERSVSNTFVTTPGTSVQSRRSSASKFEFKSTDTPQRKLNFTAVSNNANVVKGSMWRGTNRASNKTNSISTTHVPRPTSSWFKIDFINAKKLQTNREGSNTSSGLQHGKNSTVLHKPHTNTTRNNAGNKWLKHIKTTRKFIDSRKDGNDTKRNLQKSTNSTGNFFKLDKNSTQYKPLKHNHTQGIKISKHNSINTKQRNTNTRNINSSSLSKGNNRHKPTDSSEELLDEAYQGDSEELPNRRENQETKTQKVNKNSYDKTNKSDSLRMKNSIVLPRRAKQRRGSKRKRPAAGRAKKGRLNKHL